MGYQTNLMVYGPGGYRFLDFTRVGARLNFVDRGDDLDPPDLGKSDRWRLGASLGFIRRMNATSFLRRGFLITAGTLSVGVGVVGIFLPILPTTPFLLVAAACYVRSSNRLYRWLLRNRVTSNYIASYRAGKGIPARAKASSICVLWLTLAASAFMVQIWWIWLILSAVAVAVPLRILSLPTLESRAVRHL